MWRLKPGRPLRLSPPPKKHCIGDKGGMSLPVDIMRPPFGEDSPEANPSRTPGTTYNCLIWDIGYFRTPGPKEWQQDVLMSCVHSEALGGSLWNGPSAYSSWVLLTFLCLHLSMICQSLKGVCTSLVKHNLILRGLPSQHHSCGLPRDPVMSTILLRSQNSNCCKQKQMSSPFFLPNSTAWT